METDKFSPRVMAINTHAKETKKELRRKNDRKQMDK